jgi:hypothetical protein
MNSAHWLPKPEDELLHSPSGDISLPWKDTWYFSMRDDVADVTLNMHMTISADRSPDTRVAVGIRHRAREIVEVLRSDGVHTDSILGNDLVALEVVNLSWDSAHELRWRGSLPDAEFDVTVRGRHFAPFFDAMFPGYYPTGKFGHSYSHIEQMIRVDGWLRWREDTAPVSVSGFGWRDRGWGRRKSEISFDSGYDLVAGFLPGGEAFAFTAIRHPEVPAEDPMPLAGWLADEATLVPAVSGLYHKDAMSWPAALDLTFADGHRVQGTLRRRTSTLGTPFHDAEPEHSGIAHGARDHYAVFIDPAGRPIPIFSNEGHMLRVDVTRGGAFRGPGWC